MELEHREFTFLLSTRKSFSPDPSPMLPNLAKNVLQNSEDIQKVLRNTIKGMKDEMPDLILRTQTTMTKRLSLKGTTSPVTQRPETPHHVKDHQGSRLPSAANKISKGVAFSNKKPSKADWLGSACISPTTYTIFNSQKSLILKEHLSNQKLIFLYNVTTKLKSVILKFIPIPVSEYGQEGNKKLASYKYMYRYICSFNFTRDLEYEALAFQCIYQASKAITTATLSGGAIFHQKGDLPICCTGTTYTSSMRIISENHMLPNHTINSLPITVTLTEAEMVINTMASDLQTLRYALSLARTLDLRTNLLYNVMYLYIYMYTLAFIILLLLSLYYEQLLLNQAKANVPYCKKMSSYNETIGFITAV